MASNAEPRSTRMVIQFFALAFGLSWAVWIPAALASRKLLPLEIPPWLSSLLGVFGPSAAAVLLTAMHDGAAGLKTLLKRLFLWHVGIRWYAFALLFPAALSLAHSGLHVLFGGQAPDFANSPFRRVFPLPPELAKVSVWVLLPPVFLQQLVLSSPMGEEIGWRGYAFPKLQARMSALNASLLIGLLWSLWHLPLFFTVGDPRANLSIGWLMLGILPTAILFTWVYNNTEGSLLLALLYHNAINITGLFLAAPQGSPHWPILMNWLVAIVVIGACGPARLSHYPPAARLGERKQ